MMDNIFICTDPAGNIKADKEKSTEKIDGAIATIIGLDRAIRCGAANGASVYDERGILFIKKGNRFAMFPILMLACSSYLLTNLF